MTDQELIDLVKEIASASGGEKIEPMKRLLSTSEGERLVNWCYNPFITFGVTWKAKPKSSRQSDGTECDFSRIEVLLDRLASRNLTGNAAREEIEALAASLSQPGQLLLWHCLNRDLKAGVNTSTIKTVRPGLIPLFAVMRAHPFEEKRVKSFPVAVEPKLDGFRTTFIAKDGSGAFLTRSGRPMKSLEHMVEPMLRTLKHWLNETQLMSAEKAKGDVRSQVSSVRGIPNIVLDGEMMTDKGFNDTSGALRRESEQATGAHYNIFDCLTWEEFDPIGSVEVQYVARRNRVRTIVTAAGLLGLDDRVRETPISIARSQDDIQEIYARHRSQGHEGSMVKDPLGFYDKKKSYGWLKMKNEDTEDCYIVDAYLGEPGTKYEHCLGGVVIERLHEGEVVRCNVGGGFTDVEREHLWKMFEEDRQGMTDGSKFTSSEPGKLIGRMIEVEYHEITEAGRYRHPRFLCFRDDKAMEIDK